MSEVTTQNQYIWIELAKLLSSGGMIRKHFVRVDDINAIKKFVSKYQHIDVFYSICIYSSPDNETNDFILPLFFDIDSKHNLPVTRESGLILCEMITNRIGVPLDCIEIYFSGNKGFHIIVPPAVFQPFSTPYALILNKRMAEKAEQAGVKFIDKGIYTNKRIFRWPNTINSKSGLYKIPLTYKELRDMDISRIVKLAENPRPEDTYAVPRVCEVAFHWYCKAIECVHNNKNLNLSLGRRINTNFKKGWRMPPCVKAVEEAVIPDGMRHDIYLSFSRYCRYLNMHPDEIMERIETIDNRNPIRDPSSIERIIKFGCEHPGFPGCDSVLKDFCNKSRCFYAKLQGSKTEKSKGRL